MNISSLEQTITEMQDQRRLLDSAINQLQEVLDALNGRTEQTSIAIPREKKLSISDLGIKILEEHGKPMHIKEIAKKAGEMRGRQVSRTSMQASFMQTIKRAMKAGNKVPVRKFGRGVFELIE
jgi:uncharacterized protein YaaW (UPF0174 family)